MLIDCGSADLTPMEVYINSCPIDSACTYPNVLNSQFQTNSTKFDPITTYQLGYPNLTGGFVTQFIAGFKNTHSSKCNISSEAFFSTIQTFALGSFETSGSSTRIQLDSNRYQQFRINIESPNELLTVTLKPVDVTKNVTKFALYYSPTASDNSQNLLQAVELGRQVGEDGFTVNFAGVVPPNQPFVIYNFGKNGTFYLQVSNNKISWGYWLIIGIALGLGVFTVVIIIFFRKTREEHGYEPI